MGFLALHLCLQTSVKRSYPRASISSSPGGDAAVGTRGELILVQMEKGQGGQFLQRPGWSWLQSRNFWEYSCGWWPEY